MDEDSFHFVGLGGIGMSALARILLQRGKRVQGSDAKLSHATKLLENLGAKVFEGHRAESLQEPIQVVLSSAITKENPERRRAEELGFPILHRADLLKELCAPYFTLLITGTHGKTTTSGLLTHLLITAGKDPSYALGGYLAPLGINGHHGEGPYFVAEADESDGSFLKYRGDAAIITNLEADHLDYWGSLDHLKAGFVQFMHGLTRKDLLIWCYDDPLLRELELPGLSYGLRPDADATIHNVQMRPGFLSWTIIQGKNIYSDLALPMFGLHNVLNATSVFLLGLQLGLSEEAMRQGFKTFGGMGRRLEKKGEAQGILFYDDYGHHPTEILVTLEALKHSFPDRRLVVLFQPHRLTRVRDCFEEFTKAFPSADLVIMTSIFTAGEKPIEGISDKRLFDALRMQKSASLFIEKAALLERVTDFLQPGDLVLTLGAGDITYLAPQIIERLQNHSIVL